MPLLSVICVADGMLVPLREAALGAAALIDAAMALLFGDACESAEPLPPHAAIARHEAASAALKRLIARRIERFLGMPVRYRVTVLRVMLAMRKCRSEATGRR